ncbi:MAG: nucleoside kinase [Chlamydiae bacterium]|nr:MAG: nucleoside kinase [Chlamydiota bacterium]
MKKLHQIIKEVEPSNFIQITMPDGKTLQAPKGTTLEQFVRFHSKKKFKYLAALVNGKLRELTNKPRCSEIINPLDLTTSEGVRIYRRTLSFVLVTAAQEVFPEAEIHIEYTVPYGGFFCTVRGCEQFSNSELKKLEKRMREIVKEDNSIRRVPVPLEKARIIFTKRGEKDKVSLVDKRGKDDFMMYHLRNRKDAFYGYMLPSTGYLKLFKLIKAKNGFVLQYPRRATPDKLLPKYSSRHLDNVFQEYGNWLNLLDVENVGKINSLIEKGKARGIILVSEALQERKIADIAGKVAEKSDKVKLIFIAGPSSSGKTTFSKRLAIQLLAHGLKPFTLEMDRYFVERKDTPLDENGEYNFEVIEALDRKLLSSNLKSLISGKKVTLPKFNFITGTREKGPTVKLSKSHIIIAEGIHGLNPELVPSISSDKIYRIYISALTQLNIDRHNRISTTDTRLVRRLVRDSAHRGADAERTLSMWEKVRRGEKKNIFPYQENADVMFNSALTYELAALKQVAFPLLLQVKINSPNNVTAKRMLAFLNLFDDIPLEIIPDNSLLREFVGGSILRDYLPGKID